MLYSRVVKGAVNFIVLRLGFGVGAGGPVGSRGPFPLPGTPSVSDQMPATKVRRVPRGMGQRVGSPPGSPQCQRLLSCIFSLLCVPPPESDRSVHFTLIVLREGHVPLPSAL